MKSFTKTYEIRAEPKAVFKALTDEASIEAWTGTTAVMDTETNGIFSLWSGNIHGRNISVEPDRIEQKWMEARWKDHSTVTILLEDLGDKTKITVEQHHIPELSYTEVIKTWDDFYFTPLTQYLENDEE